MRFVKKSVADANDHFLYSTADCIVLLKYSLDFTVQQSVSK